MARYEYGGWSPDDFEDGRFADVDRLIADEVPEGMTVEYKDGGLLRRESKAKWTHEVCSQVAGLANTAGGILVIGIHTKLQKATQVEIPERVSTACEALDIARLNDICATGISPPVDIGGCRLLRYPAPDQGPGNVYVVFVPTSPRAPHMVTSKSGEKSDWYGKYVHRGEKGLAVMLDPHVRDVMWRRQRPDLQIGEREPAQVQRSGAEARDLVLFLGLTNFGRAAADDWRVNLHLVGSGPWPEAHPALRYEAPTRSAGGVRCVWTTGEALLPPDTENLRLPICHHGPLQDGLLSYEIICDSLARDAEMSVWRLRLQARCTDGEIEQPTVEIQSVADADRDSAAPRDWEFVPIQSGVS